LSQLDIVSCPCCESGQTILSNIEKTYVVRPLGLSVTYQYRNCGVCGFFFVANPLSQTDLENYYVRSETYRAVADVDPIELAVFADQARFVARRRNLAGATVLEIGCDTAQFLDFIAQQYGAVTYFDEKSETARRIISDKKIHRNAEDEPEERFDIVVMRHVFEHIVLPADYLKSLHHRLRPSGSIFIEVPDWTYLDDDTDSIIFEHVNQFTVSAMALLLDRCGFVVRQTEMARTPGYHTTPNHVLRVEAAPKGWWPRETRLDRLRQNYQRVYGGVYAVVRQLLEELPRPRIGIYAASWIAQDVIANLKLSNADISDVFDGDPRKWGTEFLGFPVKRPEDIVKQPPDVVLILSTYQVDICRRLDELGYVGRRVLYSDIAAGQ